MTLRRVVLSLYPASCNLIRWFLFVCLFVFSKQPLGSVYVLYLNLSMDLTFSRKSAE